jgi:hypothetical protein
MHVDSSNCGEQESRSDLRSHHNPHSSVTDTRASEAGSDSWSMVCPALLKLSEGLEACKSSSSEDTLLTPLFNPSLSTLNPGPPSCHAGSGTFAKNKICRIDKIVLSQIWERCQTSTATPMSLSSRSHQASALYTHGGQQAAPKPSHQLTTTKTRLGRCSGGVARIYKI